MSVFLPDYTFSGTVAASTTDLPTVDCQGFSSGQLFVYSNTDFHVDILWSSDRGVNVDLIDLSGVQASGTTYSASFAIKARYFALRIAEDVAVGGSTYRYSCYLNANAPMSDTFTLANIGIGADWYKPEGEMKSMYCSDGSMTIVVHNDDIDIQANWPILSGVLQTDNKTEGYDIDMTLGSCLKTTSGDMCVSVNGGAGTLNLDGNLVITGDVTSVDSKTLSVADSSILLNSGYTTTTGKAAYVVNNHLPTSNIAAIDGQFVAGVAGVSAPRLLTDSAYTFSVGDIVQITGANLEENDALYEVQQDFLGVLTLKGTGLFPNTFSFFRNNVTTDPTPGGSVTLMNVAALRHSAAGTWEKSNIAASTSGLSFSGFSPAKSYVNGYMSSHVGSGELNVAYTIGLTSGDWDTSVAGRFKYTGSVTKVFRVSLSGSLVTYGPLMVVEIRKNGSTIIGNGSINSSDSINGVGVPNLALLISLATNDYISGFVDISCTFQRVHMVITEV